MEGTAGPPVGRRVQKTHKVQGVHAQSLQLFLSLPNPKDCQAPPSMGFSRQEYWSGLPCPSPGDLLDPGIELASFMSPAVAGGFFTTSATIVKAKSLSRVRLFVTPWTVAYQASQSMEFSRQEYWSGLPFPSPGDLPNPGIEPGSPTLQANALPFELPGKPTITII